MVGLVRAVLVASLLLQGGKAWAGGGIFVPPSRVDVAPVTMAMGDRVATGFHLTAGLHWASLWPFKTAYDVGIGYLNNTFPANGAVLPPSAEAGCVPPAHSPWQIHGTYLELSRRLGPASRTRRGWLGIRGEMLFADVAGDTRMGAGLTGRAAWELYAPVKGGGNNGGVVGTFAVGFFIEASYRRLPSGIFGVSGTAGLSLRVPLIAIGG